ncbi:hypothetical protein Pcinc_015367 [Petrolisthes cinctipes]|uniref:Uncharacterized protein n=1 Tax=Petrolisthes cinctipes TaxID=88211 RepID=A0AAE1FUG2_PETCI|nr:hypothetical protein Pcinc_015367 [Petrolisthes cinctipes]
MAPPHPQRVANCRRMASFGGKMRYNGNTAPELFANLSADCHPVAAKSHRYSYDDRKFIEMETQRLLKEGIIELRTPHGVLKSLLLRVSLESDA